MKIAGDKREKITVQRRGLPGGLNGGGRYRVEKLTNTPAVTLDDKKFEVGDYITARDLENFCGRPCLEVTILAAKE